MEEKVREKLNKLIGKKIKEIKEENDDVLVFTECGEKKSLKYDVFDGLVELKLANHMTIRKWEKSTIKEVDMDVRFVYLYTNTCVISIVLVGVKKCRNVKLSENGLELIITIETFENDLANVYYIKDTRRNKWVVSELNQEESTRFIEKIEQYDLPSHPSIRMKLIL